MKLATVRSKITYPRNRIRYWDLILCILSNLELPFRTCPMPYSKMLYLHNLPICRAYYNTTKTIISSHQICLTSIRCTSKYPRKPCHIYPLTYKTMLKQVQLQHDYDRCLL